MSRGRRERGLHLALERQHGVPRLVLNRQLETRRAWQPAERPAGRRGHIQTRRGPGEKLEDAGAAVAVQRRAVNHQLQGHDARRARPRRGRANGGGTAGRDGRGAWHVAKHAKVVAGVKDAAGQSHGLEAGDGRRGGLRGVPRLPRFLLTLFDQSING
jgi:hypothetical protein